VVLLARWLIVVGICGVAGVLAPGATAEQASQPSSIAAGRLDAGNFHSCALLLSSSALRCWGFSGDGQLGYGNTNAIGDDETPAAVGPVILGDGHVASAVGTGGYHTCAVRDDARVLCWGSGLDGQLGYGNTRNIGDDETPGSVGPVDLGDGHTAKAISAGDSHTCAVRDDDKVICWGFAGYYATGYYYRGPYNNIGDNETPGSVGPVDLGAGHTAKAISAGGRHTCAILDDNSVRCWGNGAEGQVGYPNPNTILTPATEGPVDLGQDGSGRKFTAVAISAGGAHTCAILDTGTVRCWGYGADGQLGYANTASIGDNETPGTAGPVDLGPERTAVAISAGRSHTCAVLDDSSVRCWGLGAGGRLGYGNTRNVGDNETPASAGPVNLGPGRTAVAISAGDSHTCARLDDGGVRCWGNAGNGRLGYCSPQSIGDNETPDAAGPVDIGAGGAGCTGPVAPMTTQGSTSGAAAGATPVSLSALSPILLVASDAVRARGFRRCLAGVAAHARRERRAARHGSVGGRARARRHLAHHARSGRRVCLRRFGRTPGRISGLHATAVGHSAVKLDFSAAGTNGDRPPPAQRYLIRQSLRPIRSIDDFAHAQSLCRGSCRFTVSEVGGRISLAVGDLRPRTTYYYAVAARDNVSGRPGPRSPGVRVTTG